jgi:phosphosulfolactate synthase (CoM biosynthesis protein A)
MSKPDDRPFSFLHTNRRSGKPRKTGITEIRGPYYTPLGKRQLADVLETMGPSIDALKFGGGAFAVMPKAAVVELIELCHQHDVTVSTGGFIEFVLTQGPESVEKYLAEVKAMGFDTVEVSSGFITLPLDDWCRLVAKVVSHGLKAKAEVGIQFGAGGASSPDALEAAGQGDPGWMIAKAKRLLQAGAYQIMIESEGITEQVKTWRTDVPAKVADELGLEKVMFEAADPAVFGWYVQNYGPEVNLFIDHSQIVQLECLRSGIWGTSDLFGRVLSYKA